MAALMTKALRAYAKAEEGALIVFALFLFVLMAMMGGIAIDLQRYETTRTQLSQTLGPLHADGRKPDAAAGPSAGGRGLR